MQEIERKFLVRDDSWRAQVSKRTPIQQGYLARAPGPTVRVRRAGDEAFLTIKGETQGISRVELEYAIPTEEAVLMLETLCTGGRIMKERFFVEVAGKMWTIDVFEGENAGLTLAEVELEHEEESLVMPEWAGEEVSHDARYFNSALLTHPFSVW